MSDFEIEAAERRFIEDAGIVFENSGLPRMAGRILGWLLISDPPQQSTTELACKLEASKGSVSTMTRLLIRLGAIEIVGVAGARVNYFHVNSDAFSRLLSEVVQWLSSVRDLSERGLRIMDGREPSLRERVESMYDFYSFLDQEIPSTLRRWQEEERHSRRLARTAGQPDSYE